MDQRAIRVLPGNTFPTGFLSPLHPFGLPFEWDPTDPDPLNPTISPTPDRQGEDLMLGNVLAFDVRVFDPAAPLVQVPPPPANGTVLEPSDQGWTNPTALADIVGFGAYVDLGWEPFYPRPAIAANVPETQFQFQRQAGWHPLNTSVGFPAIYDTWSFHYEHDGLDQDDTSGNDNVSDFNPNTGLTDEGTNGLDDNNQDGVDDFLERETSPPYPVPLRGMQVILRIYDPDTRQIRQATVNRSFVPQ